MDAGDGRIGLVEIDLVDPVLHRQQRGLGGEHDAANQRGKEGLGNEGAGCRRQEVGDAAFEESTSERIPFRVLNPCFFNAL